MLLAATVVTAVLTVGSLGFAIAMAGGATRHELFSTLTLVDTFVRLLNDASFWHSLTVTLQLFGLCLVAELALGTLLGLLLSFEVPGRRVVLGVLLLPIMVSSVALGSVWLLLLDPSLGLIGRWLNLSTSGEIALLASPDTALATIALIDIWQWTPFVGILIAAGIRGIPAGVREAAAIDRAGALAEFLFVLLPLLRPTIVAILVLRSIDLLRSFDMVYVMTQGGPVNATMTLNLLAYRTAFVGSDFASAAAIQLLTVAVVVITVLIVGMVARAAAFR